MCHPENCQNYFSSGSCEKLTPSCPWLAWKTASVLHQIPVPLLLPTPPPRTSSTCGTRLCSASVMQQALSEIANSVSEIMAVLHPATLSSVSEMPAGPLRLFSGAMILTQATGSAFTSCGSKRDSSSVKNLLLLRQHLQHRRHVLLKKRRCCWCGCALGTGDPDRNVGHGERRRYSKSSSLGDGGGDACGLRSPSSSSSSLSKAEMLIARDCEGHDRFANSEFKVTWASIQVSCAQCPATSPIRVWFGGTLFASVTGSSPKFLHYFLESLCIVDEPCTCITHVHTEIFPPVLRMPLATQFVCIGHSFQSKH